MIKIEPQPDYVQVWAPRELVKFFTQRKSRSRAIAATSTDIMEDNAKKYTKTEIE